jgi:hypothetical protein
MDFNCEQHTTSRPFKICLLKKFQRTQKKKHAIVGLFFNVLGSTSTKFIKKNIMENSIRRNNVIFLLFD